MWRQGDCSGTLISCALVMKTKTKAASVSVVVNVGRDKKKPKRRSTRKRKLGVLAPGQVAPLRGIYDNANERAVHFSNFPAQRVIHESLPTAPTAPQTPVQQFFMNPGATPLLGPPKVEELGSPAPRPPFYEPKVESYVAAPPQRQGLGAETPHTPETFKTNQNPTFSERREPYDLRPNPKPKAPYTPPAWKK